MESEEANLTQEPDDELPVTRPHNVVFPAHIYTIRDEFADMSRRLPAGFGGLFFDKSGILNIVVVDQSRSGETLTALQDESFIRNRRDVSHIQAFNLAGSRIQEGRYSYHELYDWYNILIEHLSFTPSMGSISVPRNRIVIGIEEDAQLAEVQRTIANAGIPLEAVIIERAPVIHLTSVRSEHRPVPAGIQVEWLNLQGDIRPCTLGPNLIRLGQRGFLVNSHCTKIFGEVDWNDVTHYWQHRRRWYQQNHRHIGNEAIDPPVRSCANPRGCRYSDAALGLYRSGVQSQLGYIARPATRDQENLSLHPTQPRFSITGSIGYSVTGEILEKVGRTTGWSGGVVVDGCADLTLPDDITLWCQIIVDALAGEGDSGSPVFRINTGTQVELRGMVWAGTGSCWRNADWVLFCDQFIASNLGSIEQEVGAGTSLQFYSTGGGGGDPRDPRCVENPDGVLICPDSNPDVTLRR